MGGSLHIAELDLVGRVGGIHLDKDDHFQLTMSHWLRGYVSCVAGIMLLEASLNGWQP